MLSSCLCFHPPQEHPSLDSRHFVCRRSSQNPLPISWSHMAAVSFPLWALWWSASKPFRPSFLRFSTRSKVNFLHINISWWCMVSNVKVLFLFFPVCASVLHEVEEDTVEFSWKRNRLFNHTACLVLYQICMEVCNCLSWGLWCVYRKYLSLYTQVIFNYCHFFTNLKSQIRLSTSEHKNHFFVVERTENKYNCITTVHGLLR